MANPWEMDWSSPGVAPGVPAGKKPWEMDWKTADVAPQTGLLEQGGAGLNDGIASMAGMPVDALTGAVNYVGGKFGMDPIQNPVGGSESIRGGINALVGEAPEPQTGGQRIARRVGQDVGAGAVAGPLTGATSLGTTALNTVSNAMSGLSGGVSAEMGASPTVQMIASLLGGGGTAYAGGKIMDRASQASSAAASVPSVDKLKADASALYKDAEINGITATQPETAALAQTVRGVATSNGLISPTGRLSSAYPKVSDAIAMVDDYAKGTMTPTQMQEVRKLLQGAAQSADGGEARIGTMMLREFDAFTSNLAPQFKDANALYSKAMKGDKIDQLIELAGLQAGQFTGSGFENALRTQFRGYARQIVKGQVKGLSQAEIDAINKVANGGRLENALRDLGKLAPTGVVSAGISGGIPYMIGNSVGGPAVGAAAAGATMAAGTAGRMAATSMQKNNAEIAAALARNGGAPIPYASGMSDAVRQVVTALAAQQAARTTSGAQ